MKFNQHYGLEGCHAFLGASKYHWINYSEEKLDETFKRYRSAQLGTRLHELAKEHIELGIKMPKTKKTLNMYINDAIGYKMTPEQVLYFSDNCFGTADTISFKHNLLRIHDLKTGENKAHMEQLEVYAALFCLEYGMNPAKIDMELRIYQNDEIVIFEPTIEDIAPIIDKIITFDKRIEALKEVE